MCNHGYESSSEDFVIVRAPAAAAGAAPRRFPRIDGAPEVLALLDGAKLSWLADTLRSSDVPHVCLYGTFGDGMVQDMGPFLIDMTAPSGLRDGLLASGEAPWELWDKSPGLILWCDAGLGLVARHLRKFTRMPDEDGSWHLVRFWESFAVPVFAQFLFGPTANSPSPIRAIGVPDGDTIVLYRNQTANSPEGPSRLIDGAMRRDLAAARLDWVSTKCMSNASRLFAPHHPDASTRLARDGRRLLADLLHSGMKRERDWMIFLGILALQGRRPTPEDLRAVDLQTTVPQKVRFLRERMQDA